MITVGELIEKLRAFDPALPVVTPGFDESGFNHIGEPESITIRQSGRPGQHSGEFEKSDAFGLNLRWEGEPFEAVVVDFE